MYKRQLASFKGVHTTAIIPMLCITVVMIIPPILVFIFAQRYIAVSYTHLDVYKRQLIRDCCNYRGLGKGYYRIAVKGREDNERLSLIHI